jgi:hypothetical protein
VQAARQTAFAEEAQRRGCSVAEGLLESCAVCGGEGGAVPFGSLASHMGIGGANGDSSLDGVNDSGKAVAGQP